MKGLRKTKTEVTAWMRRHPFAAQDGRYVGPWIDDAIQAVTGRRPEIRLSALNPIEKRVAQLSRWAGCCDGLGHPCLPDVRAARACAFARNAAHNAAARAGFSAQQNARLTAWSNIAPEAVEGRGHEAALAL